MPWWWKSLFRKGALDAQLSSEVRFHIDELTDANRAAGMSPDEARRRAVLFFVRSDRSGRRLRSHFSTRRVLLSLEVSYERCQECDCGVNRRRRKRGFGTCSEPAAHDCAIGEGPLRLDQQKSLGNGQGLP